MDSGLDNQGLRGFLPNDISQLRHLHATRQSGSFVDGSFPFPLVFEKLPDVNQEGSQWTDCEIREAINLIYHV